MTTAILLCVQSGFAQQFTLAQVPVERSEIEKDKFSIYRQAELFDNFYWVHALDTGWQHVIGYMKNDQLIQVYRDNLTDGYFGRVFFYRSDEDSDHYILVSVLDYDDGIGAMLFFEHQEEVVTYLGDLVLFTNSNDDLPGYPKEEMTIQKKDGNLYLLFDEGKYLYLNDYKEHVLTGPFELVLEGNSFELN